MFTCFTFITGFYSFRYILDLSSQQDTMSFRFGPLTCGIRSNYNQSKLCTTYPTLRICRVRATNMHTNKNTTVQRWPSNVTEIVTQNHGQIDGSRVCSYVCACVCMYFCIVWHVIVSQTDVLHVGKTRRVTANEESERTQTTFRTSTALCALPIQSHYHDQRTTSSVVLLLLLPLPLSLWQLLLLLLMSYANASVRTRSLRIP